MFPEFFHKTFYLIYEFLFLYYNLSHGGLVKYKCSLFLLLSWGSEGFKKNGLWKKAFYIISDTWRLASLYCGCFSLSFETAYCIVGDISSIITPIFKCWMFTLSSLFIKEYKLFNTSKIINYKLLFFLTQEDIKRCVLIAFGYSAFNLLLWISCM